MIELGSSMNMSKELVALEERSVTLANLIHLVFQREMECSNNVDPYGQLDWFDLRCYYIREQNEILCKIRDIIS